jgi:hypothetical protein
MVTYNRRGQHDRGLCPESSRQCCIRQSTVQALLVIGGCRINVTHLALYGHKHVLAQFEWPVQCTPLKRPDVIENTEVSNV